MTAKRMRSLAPRMPLRDAAESPSTGVAVLTADAKLAAPAAATDLATKLRRVMMLIGSSC